MEKKTNDEGNASMNSKAQLVIVFLIGLLLGLLIGPTFSGDRADEADRQDDAMEETMDGENGDAMEEGDMSGEAMSTNSSVSVESQLPGSSVVLNKISMDERGWVVIHESVNGVPANALGAQLFDAGDYPEGGVVELLRNTEAGNVYFAIVYKDNGDGAFNIKEDRPLGEGENTVSTTFETVQPDRKN